jgi:hypothetical protein
MGFCRRLPYNSSNYGTGAGHAAFSQCRGETVEELDQIFAAAPRSRSGSLLTPDSRAVRAELNDSRLLHNGHLWTVTSTRSNMMYGNS